MKNISANVKGRIYGLTLLIIANILFSIKIPEMIDQKDLLSEVAVHTVPFLAFFSLIFGVVLIISPKLFLKESKR